MSFKICHEDTDGALPSGLLGAAKGVETVGFFVRVFELLEMDEGKTLADEVSHFGSTGDIFDVEFLSYSPLRGMYTLKSGTK